MKSFLSLCFVFILCLAKAQSLSPIVFSSAGAELSNGTNSFTCTLGELLTSSGNLSVGFQEVNVVVTAIKVEKKNNLSITVFPNPAVDIVQLKFSEVVKDVVVTIYSAEGKLVYSEKKSNQSLSIVNVSSLSNGVYSLKLSGDISAHYQLVKLK